jgi:hypothetical protein
MKRWMIALFVLGLTVSNSAQAWYFFFISVRIPPPKVDSVSDANGKLCVKEGTQVGQILTSENGNTAKVILLSGTSPICPNPALPIRAELKFTNTFSSQAGIELPDDFQSIPLGDLQIFNGSILLAMSKRTKNHAIVISSMPKKANSDIETIANNLERQSLNNPKLKNVTSTRTEKLTIQGMPAIRFEISATLGGILGPRLVYQYTLIESDKEVVLVNVYAPVDYMDENRQKLQKLAEQIKGLHSAEPMLPSTVPAVGQPGARG